VLTRSPFAAFPTSPSPRHLPTVSRTLRASSTLLPQLSYVDTPLFSFLDPSSRLTSFYFLCNRLPRRARLSPPRLLLREPLPPLHLELNHPDKLELRTLPLPESVELPPLNRPLPKTELDLSTSEAPSSPVSSPPSLLSLSKRYKPDNSYLLISFEFPPFASFVPRLSLSQILYNTTPTVLSLSP
jgi:hypothetical protein